MARPARSSLLVLLAALLIPWCAPGPAVADTTVDVRLQQMNHSGVDGTVVLTGREDGELTVTIHARGLVPAQPHAQHLHGTLGGHFTCPTMRADADGDGLLTNEEASGEYGDVFVALTTRGDASVKSGLDATRMPVADSQGRVDYERTFAADELPKGLVDQLHRLHVVLHGIDVNGNGRYDVAGAGVSAFARNQGLPGVPEEITNPAACGMVTGAGSAMSPIGGVETGGGSTNGREPALAWLGGCLLAGSLMVLAVRRSRRVS